MSAETILNDSVESTEPKAAAIELRLSDEAWFWVLTLGLIAVGTVMVYSSSSIMALKRFGDSYYYLKRQFIVVAVGAGVLYVVSRIPYLWYQSTSRILLLVALIGLGLVWIPGVGVEFNGARRWFRVGRFFVQPSEICKVVWVVYLSCYCARKGERLKDFTNGLAPPLILFVVMAGLLILEPDLGTSLVLGGVTVLLLFAGGARWTHLAALTMPALTALYLFVYHVPYRWQRVVAFLDPWTDPLDSGYHLIQSWIAVGSGGVLGKGLGAGHQKLFYLPEPFTDFIFAVIGEELGFVGIAVIVALFVLLICRGLKVSRGAKDAFGCHLALGLTALLLIQTVTNMGVVLGLLPTKGLALPFISYGGSALTANCAIVGMLISIARTSDRQDLKHV